MAQGACGVVIIRHDIQIRWIGWTAWSERQTGHTKLIKPSIVVGRGKHVEMQMQMHICTSQGRRLV